MKAHQVRGIYMRPPLAISEFLLPLYVSKRVFVQNHSYENVFRLQVHFHVNQTHFHLKGFARGLALEQMHQVNWEIIY